MSQQSSINGFLRPGPPGRDARRDDTNHRPSIDIPGAASDSLTVLLADPQPAIRHGIRSVLNRSAGISVVGEAATMDEVIAEVSRSRPKVLVIDPLIDNPCDVRVIAEVLRVSPGTGILVFSSVDDDSAIRSVIQAGARGYLFKSADSDQILRCIQAVGAGQAIIDKVIADRLCTLLYSAIESHSYPFPQLTDRERDVLERIAAGKSNAIIARELALASKTISNRISVILTKLGVADRVQAIVLARDAGLGRR
jgi:DNA-binding NarL/FixJ family response regulator